MCKQTQGTDDTGVEAQTKCCSEGGRDLRGARMDAGKEEATTDFTREQDKDKDVLNNESRF